MIKIWHEGGTVKKEIAKCFVIISASEAESTISFCQQGDSTVQNEVAHQSNLNMLAGN